MTETKKIGGEKNGGQRVVVRPRAKRYVATIENKKKLPTNKKKAFSVRKQGRLRPSIVPGTILILLAGRHRGKRVVFLKQLPSGLLLVTGPYFINGVPLRRVNQTYVIATKTKVDVSGVNVPDRVVDAYFKKPKKVKKGGEELFEDTQAHSVKAELKEDQPVVDKQVLAGLKKDADAKILMKYLATHFSLGNKQYPHKMVF